MIGAPDLVVRHRYDPIPTAKNKERHSEELNRDIAEWFADYATTMWDALGDRVELTGGDARAQLGLQHVEDARQDLASGPHRGDLVGARSGERGRGQCLDLDAAGGEAIEQALDQRLDEVVPVVPTVTDCEPAAEPS